MDTNPMKLLPWTEGAFDTYQKYGYMMFPQQRAIYERLADQLAGRQVLEAGCGIGLGSAILERRVDQLIATDSLEENVKIADALYPWVRFGVWDAMRPRPWDAKAEVVVTVEVLEHVAEPELFLRNLCDAASAEVWISTPNGRGKPKPPSNPYHVAEYEPWQVMAMAQDFGIVRVYDHRTWESVGIDTDADPVVYRILLT